jgi:glucokinase
VSENKLFGKLEQERLLSTLDGLDAVDKALSQAEELVHGRSTPADVQMSAEEIEEIQEAESLFLRFYPLILTGLFLVLVVGGNIFFDKGGWSLWMPYFVLAALSFALPHPFGAAATLLVALVVAASSFV